jgi:hypothetical protein
LAPGSPDWRGQALTLAIIATLASRPLGLDGVVTEHQTVLE